MSCDESLRRPAAQAAAWVVVISLLVGGLLLPAGNADAGVPAPTEGADRPVDIRSKLAPYQISDAEPGESRKQMRRSRPASARGEKDGPADQATSDVFYSVADACVLQGYPTLKLGDAVDMWAGYDEDLEPDGEIARSLVRFDLDALPDGQEIIEATLRLYLVSSWDFPDTSRTIRTYRATSAWSEGSVTWNNKPGFGEAYGSQSILSQAWDWYGFDVTELVRAWYDGTYSNNGIMVRGPEVSGDQSSWRGFGTKESADFVPELVVEYASANTPPNEPSNPTPADGATDVSTDADLSWTGGDPDPGDTVTYDVYLAADDATPDTLVCDDTTDTTCDPGTLDPDTEYFWYVEATDSQSASTTGDTWDFTTEAAANTRPNEPSSPTPADGATDVSTDADLSWSGGDPDPGDTVTYDVYLQGGGSPSRARVLRKERLGITAAKTTNLVWETRTDMPTARTTEVVEAANGKLYAIGGYDGSDYVGTVEAYDPTTDAWTTRASMPTPRTSLGVATVNGKIYAIGGYDGSQALDVVEVYDPATNTWLSRQDMPTARSGLGVAVMNGKVYAIGGKNGSVSAAVEAYDPATDSWTTRESMPAGRSALAVTEAHGKIYAIGGYDGSDYVGSVEAYDPATDTWTSRSSMPSHRSSPGVAAVGGRVFVIGGTASQGGLPVAEDVVEVYDPATDSWTSETSLPSDRQHPGVTAAGSGKIYVIGGVTDSFGIYGDPVYHDTVYETTVKPSELICEDVPETSMSCEPGPLNAGADYAWYVVAEDNHGASTEGEIWQFTTAQAANEPPSIAGLPDQEVAVNSTVDNAVDLWAYVDDAEDADSALSFTIHNAPAAGAGVSIDSNRYVDINPMPEWTGTTQVQIQVEDTGHLTDVDTFEVTVSASKVHLPLLVNQYPPRPAVPVLNPIDNSDGDGTYTVSWQPASLADTYLLQEDDNAAFSSPSTAYAGSGTSTPISGKAPGTYYYRVKASNTWGDSGWSNVRSVTVAEEEQFAKSGAWAGTYDSSFTVTTDNKVRDFSVTLPIPRPEGGECEIELTEEATIEDRHFSLGIVQGAFKFVEGDFSTPTTLTGIFHSVACEDQIWFYDEPLEWEASWESAGGPSPGSWDGGDISFEVTSDSEHVCNFLWEPDTPICGLDSIYSPQCASITSGQFDYQSSSLQVVGEFESATEVSGDWHVHTDTPYPCSGHGSWSADHVEE